VRRKAKLLAWVINKSMSNMTGIFEIAAAIQLRKYITGEWMLVLSGILSVLFGLLLLFNPAGGALAVIWIIGAYSVVFGVLLLILGVKLRGLERSLPHNMIPNAV